MEKMTNEEIVDEILAKKDDEWTGKDLAFIYIYSLSCDYKQNRNQEFQKKPIDSDRFEKIRTIIQENPTENNTWALIKGISDIAEYLSILLSAYNYRFSENYTRLHFECWVRHHSKLIEDELKNTNINEEGMQRISKYLYTTESLFEKQNNDIRNYELEMLHSAIYSITAISFLSKLYKNLDIEPLIDILPSCKGILIDLNNLNEEWKEILEITPEKYKKNSYKVLDIKKIESTIERVVKKLMPKRLELFERFFTSTIAEMTSEIFSKVKK